MCAFPFHFDECIGCVGDSVGRVDNSICRVHGVGSEVFVPTGIKSIGDVFPLGMFVPKLVVPKDG